MYFLDDKQKKNISCR